MDNTPIIAQPDGSFQSPTLSDGQHTLKLATGDLSGVPVFDYLTVNAGPSTPLDGRTLVVDDTEDDIQFKGSWSSTPPQPAQWGYSTSLYHDSAHWSSSVGDSFEFDFTGMCPYAFLPYPPPSVNP